MPITSTTYTNFSKAIKNTSPTYLNLYWENFLLYDWGEDNLYEKIMSAKKDIIAKATNQAIAKLNSTLKNRGASEAFVSTDKIGLLDFSLDPELVDSIDLSEYASNTTESGELSAAVQKLRRSVKKKAEFNESLDELIKSFNGSSIKNEIANWVLLHQNEARKLSSNSRYITSILKYLNSLPNGTALSTTNDMNFNNLPAKVQEWYVKLYALAEPGVRLDASSKSSIVAYLRKTQASIFNDVQAAVHDGSLHMAESLSMELCYGAQNKTDDALSHTVKVVGGEMIKVDFKPDPQILKDLQYLQEHNKQAQNAFTFKEGNVVSFSNISQKTDEAIVASNGVEDGGVSAKSTSVAGYGNNFKIKTLHLQASTPLYVLLTRDIGFSEGDLHRLIQTATAEGGNLEGYNSYSEWQSIVETVEIDAVFQALLGSSAQKNAYSTLLKVNNSIIPMYNVILAIANGLAGNPQLFNSIAGFGTSGASKGAYMADVWSNLRQLNKKYYVNNTGQGVISAALERSKNVHYAAINILYNKKIDIGLNGFNLAILAQNSLTG